MRRLYRILLYAYPPDFRRRFGREMEQVFAARRRDTAGICGLLLFTAQIGADWFLTAIHEGFASMQTPTSMPGAVGAPFFYTCESSMPRQGALVNGAILSLAVFGALFLVIGHVEVLPVPLLPGSAPPAYAPSFATKTSDNPNPNPIANQPLLVLHALDTNHDGVISRAEIADARAALRKLDRNSDARLSPEECGADPRLPDAARLAFMRWQPVLAALDTDHDGEISKTEMERAPEALWSLDKNRDGRLTKDETLPNSTSTQ